MFKALLPQEIQINESLIALDYRLVGSTDGQNKIMMVLTDVTRERSLTQQIVEEEEYNVMILKVALDRVREKIISKGDFK